MTSFDQLNRQQYLNIETFRKSGVGVKTPVWFVQKVTQSLCAQERTSGKVKRIRNNAQVKIAPCKARWHAAGEWIMLLPTR